MEPFALRYSLNNDGVGFNQLGPHFLYKKSDQFGLKVLLEAPHVLVGFQVLVG